MELSTKLKSISRKKLIKVAIIVSIFTFFWNIIEGIPSVYYGIENDSISLIFFGINSFVEVSSSCFVILRFLREITIKEKSAVNLIHYERKATFGIGLLFILLAIGTFSDATIALVKNRRPDSTLAGLIITTISLFIMAILWLVKFYIAKLLNSSTMASDAKCSLSCIQTTLVVFLGSLLYFVWKDGWWLDSVASLILSIFFAKEGLGMILWAKSKDFNGGCCCDECKITIPSKEFTNESNGYEISQNDNK
ncbi:8223_t:CDS:2 [Scutellospora calospora]|uniref:8223_t:CDS:1 n=1 Tax=Scutellospora calospora TaxID=85575 RepID=A0ACA9LI27_9GLOM|nr:8223_t:CDS:2 [Scutellospora calospora]